MSEPIKKMNHAEKTASGKEGKYLTFTLAGGEYGIEYLKIKDLKNMVLITPVPQAPGFVKGVIDLKGEVIPVVDLRLRLGMESKGYDDKTNIVVVEVEGLNGTFLTGLIVDSVSNVLYFEADQIEDMPNFSTNLAKNYIIGVAKMGGAMRILLDIEKLFDTNEMFETNSVI